MSETFFEELGIPAPAHNLGIMGGSHGQMTGRMLEQLEAVMMERKPDAVLVFGDTNSTLAGALAAAKLHIPILHVEAGLRSHNRRMPEEVNRVVTDHLSTVLFCPTATARENLANEGITDNVYEVGDVMFDTTLYARSLALEKSTVLELLGLEDRGYSLCTMHRAENTDDHERLAQMIGFLEQMAEVRPLVFPVHPRTRKVLAEKCMQPRNMILIEPVGYFDIHRLLAGADTLFTDSGGMQKEAYFHRLPCVTLREETEWVETVEAGWNRLWNVPDYRLPRRDVTDYGDGQAAAQIIDLIVKHCS
jgi:UDP-GlcNAc3NAcA epimerase